MTSLLTFIVCLVLTESKMVAKAAVTTMTMIQASTGQHDASTSKKTPSPSTTPLSKRLTTTNKGNLSCRVINDKLFLRFELPYPSQPTHILSAGRERSQQKMNHTFNLYSCSTAMTLSKTTPPPTQFMYSEDEKAGKGGKITINTLVGSYDSVFLLQPLCVRIETNDGPKNKVILNMSDFKIKSTQHPVGAAWNIFNQFKCFDRANNNNNNNNQRGVRYIAVTGSCTNISVEWENHKFDHYWFVRRQLITNTEIIEATAQTKRKPYHYQQVYTIVGGDHGEKRVYKTRQLKANTEYRVCVITDYGANGRRQKCTVIYTRCRRVDGKELPYSKGARSNAKKDGEIGWVKLTLVLSGITVGSVFLAISMFLCFVALRKKRLLLYDLSKARVDDNYHNDETSSEGVCLPRGHGEWLEASNHCHLYDVVDEIELAMNKDLKVEYHEYFQIPET